MPTTVGAAVGARRGAAGEGAAEAAAGRVVRPAAGDARSDAPRRDDRRRRSSIRAPRNPKDVAVADDLAGALTYEQLLVGALAMAARFRRLPATNVGLLLPASVGVRPRVPRAAPRRQAAGRC